LSSTGEDFAKLIIYAKCEVSISACYEDMNGDAK